MAILVCVGGIEQFPTLIIMDPIASSLRLKQIEPGKVIETATDYIYIGATDLRNATAPSDVSPISHRRTGLLQLGLVDGDLASTGRKVLSYHLQGVQRLLPLLYQAVYLAIVAYMWPILLIKDLLIM